MMSRNPKFFQKGATLMEVLIAMSISLVVTTAMVALMGNTLGTTSRIVKMTKLTDDMRVAMQMMTRDVRRSNYNADSILCYANESCWDDGSVTSAGDVRLVDTDSNGVNDCFWFLTDREHDNYASDIEAGGFRQVPVDPDDDGIFVGAIEMWTGTGDPTGSAICDDPPGTNSWAVITDPENVNISSFTVVDNEPGLSFTQVVQDDGNGKTLSQRVRKIRLNIQGELVVDDSITRTMQDIILVRNDLLF
jgi:hypothetical protein